MIVAIDHTGALLWRSHLPGQTAEYTIQVENGAPTLANFDSDPEAEIVFGATLIDDDGTVIWDAGGTNGSGGFYGTNAGYQGGIAAIADLDGDTKPEIISGKHAWTVSWNNATPALTTVTPKWTYTGNDGYPAVADLVTALARRGVGVACISDDLGEWSVLLRRRFGLERFIRPWILSSAVGVRSPSPALLEAVSQETGIAPANCLLVDVDDAHEPGR